MIRTVRKPLRRHSARQALLERERLRLLVGGEVIETGNNELVFLRTELRDAEEFSSGTLHLEGAWRLDSQNQLQFLTKYSGKVLRFAGTWKVGTNHELIYTFQRTRLKRSSVNFQTLVFRGAWKLGPKRELRYSFEGSSKSLEFTGRFVRLASSGGRAVIYYSLGAKTKKTLSGRSRDTLELFGTWKALPSLELGFEFQAPDGRPYQLRFSGSYQMTRRDEIIFNIATKNGFKKPELSVTLERKLLKGLGRIFLRGSTDFHKDHFIGVGGALKW